jgi:hypothetical protein
LLAGLLISRPLPCSCGNRSVVADWTALADFVVSDVAPETTIV